MHRWVEYEIQDDNDLKYVMVVARSIRESTKLYVSKSNIKGRDNP